MDQRRLLLFLVFSFALVMLWDGWIKHNQPAPTVQQAAAGAAAPTDGSVPTPSANLGVGQAAVPGEQQATAAAAAVARTVVETDLLRAQVSAQGGAIVRLELKQHRASAKSEDSFVLLDDGSRHQYAAQAGLIGDGLPNHRTMFELPASELVLKDGEDRVELRLRAPEQNGVQVTKVMTFHRGSYLIDVAYEIVNESVQPISPHAYFQLTRDGNQIGRAHV